MAAVLAIVLAGGIQTVSAQTAISQYPDVAQRLAALGIDPAEAVFQTGSHLYAGPACPGDGFDCVDPAGAPVVQIVVSPEGGIALAQCSDPTCTILQSAEDEQAPSDLSATCQQGTQQDPVAANPAALECVIDQDNTSGGSNRATVEQFVVQQDGRTSSSTEPHDVDQASSQSATVTQNAVGTGTNEATVQQSTFQKAETKNTTALVTHDQEGSSAAVVHQDSEDGNQSVEVDQDLTQRAEAKFNVAGVIEQRQNAVDDGPDLFAEIRQFAGEAYNTAVLNQNEDLKQEAKTGSDAITQVQGAPSGGLIGDIAGDQDAEPTDTQASSYTATVAKNFDQEAATGGTVSQTQDDAIKCCDLPFGFSDSYHDCSITGDSTLLQVPGASQSIVILLLGDVDRSCTAAYSAQTNDGSDANSATGPRVAIGTNCQTGAACQPNSAPTTGDVEASGKQGDASIPWTPDASDPDGDDLVCFIDEGPAVGTASVEADCSAGSYSAPADFHGTVTFTYGAEDTFGFRSVPGTVTITVEEVTPASGLTLRVKNANGSTYGSSATVTPLAPSADYRIGYTNDGDGTAQNVVVKHPVPSGGRVVSCTGGCQVSGSTVTWVLGDRAGGTAVTLDFRITYSITSFGTVTTKATGTSDNEAPFASNSVTVHKQCLNSLCV